ncbi:MAG: hypothetical protein AAFY38_03360 [Pseudomonadota bacterium]
MKRLISMICAGLIASAAAAESEARLGLELNTADLVGDSCRLTFVLSNGLAQEIEQLVAETVLFSSEGGVILLTLFDFGILPAGRPRVRQFEVPGTACTGIGQVLINGVATCTVAGAASPACAERLVVSSRIDIGVDG